MIIGNLISIVIILGVIVFNLFQIFKSSISLQILILVNLIAIFIAFLFNYLLNLKFRKDLKVNEKYFVTGNVTDKIEEVDYEAGSGSLYIPILGDLFPKIWGQEMKKEQIKFIKINNELFAVDNSLYESVDLNNIVKIYYSKISNTYLGIEKQ